MCDRGELQRGGARASVDRRPTPRPSWRHLEEYAYYTSTWACYRGGRVRASVDRRPTPLIHPRLAMTMCDRGELQRGDARVSVDHRPTPRPSRRHLEEYAYYTSTRACYRGGRVRASVDHQPAPLIHPRLAMTMRDRGEQQRGDARVSIDRRPTLRPSRRHLEKYANYVHYAYYPSTRIGFRVGLGLGLEPPGATPKVHHPGRPQAAR